MQQCIQPTGTNRPRAWRHTSLVLALERSGAAIFAARCGVISVIRNEKTPAERKVSGGHSGGETPVPIPNTAVKPARADGTWGEAPWESRSPPGFLIDEVPSELRLEGTLSLLGAALTDRVAMHTEPSAELPNKATPRIARCPRSRHGQTVAPRRRVRAARAPPGEAARARGAPLPAAAVRAVPGDPVAPLGPEPADVRAAVPSDQRDRGRVVLEAAPARVRGDRAARARVARADARAEAGADRRQADRPARRHGPDALPGLAVGAGPSPSPDTRRPQEEPEGAAHRAATETATSAETDAPPAAVREPAPA